jgi:cytochrome d ubiquinol oxidase subunit II
MFIAQKNDFAPAARPHMLLGRRATPQSAKAPFTYWRRVALPVILRYAGWSYWVFRGKVRGDLGYH